MQTSVEAGTGDALVRITGVAKQYPKLSTGGDRLRTLAALLFRVREIPHFTALDDINLEVWRGQSLGIVGENGAGKSTLLKIIAGVVRPTRGTVRIGGRVGALLELGSGFHPDYTGRENIYLSSALMGLSRRETKSKVDAIVDFADIGQHIDEPIKHYSSGMTVRLGFAVATALTPDILITDEVLAVGDESFQKKCIQWLEQYLSGKGTLLLCSHSMFHVQTLCRQALWIHHGRARMYGNAFDVTREYLTYHEEKRQKELAAPQPSPHGPKVESTWIEDASGKESHEFEMGEEIVVQAIIHEPDDRVPVMMLGIVRVDGTPVYGTHSNDAAFQPRRIAPNRFAFCFRLRGAALIPGKYMFGTHALDAEGLRLFHSVKVEVVVTGKTRDYGVVRLAHEWLPGREGKP
jgi:lipopolysaccharide transport system ATP-binding protein